MIDWSTIKVSKHEVEVIVAIAERARSAAIAAHVDKAHPFIEDFHGLVMDLEACHTLAAPLQLDELAGAPQSEFMHDVSGIYTHFNRATLQLEDCFSPRYARR